VEQTQPVLHHPATNVSHDHYEEDEVMVVAPEHSNQSQFFTVHEERALNDNPELNINGANGYDLDDEDDVDIGWGGANNYDDEDPDAFLYEDPFARNENNVPELEEALQDLTITDEVFGNSSALPEYNNDALAENDFVYNTNGEGNDDRPDNEILNQTSLLKPQKIYLVVRSARQAIEPPSDLNFKFYSRLSSHITLEESFCIVSISCLIGPAYVIANIPYGDAEADTESIRNFIMVKDFKEWSQYFINKENTEVYGRPLQQNNEEIEE